MSYKTRIIRQASLKGLVQKLVSLIGEEKVVALIKKVVDAAWSSTGDNTVTASLNKTAALSEEEKKQKEEEIRNKFRDEHWIKFILMQLGVGGILLIPMISLFSVLGHLPLWDASSPVSMLVSILQVLGLSAGAASVFSGSNNYIEEENEAVKKELEEKDK